MDDYEWQVIHLLTPVGLFYMFFWYWLTNEHLKKIKKLYKNWTNFWLLSAKASFRSMLELTHPSNVQGVIMTTLIGTTEP